MSSSDKELADNLQKYKERLDNLKKQNELDFSLSIEAIPIVLNENSDKEKLDFEEPRILMYQVNAIPQKKSKSQEEEEPEPEPQTICIAIIIGPDGKVLAYSIGLNQFSDEFHDVSDLNIGLGAFISQLHGTMSSSLNGGASINQAMDAVREQFPTSRTYKDAPLQAKSNELLKKWHEKNDNLAIKEKEAASPSTTPLSTTPKP